METQILSLFSPTLLIAIGISLIAFEIIFFSFIFFWFGLAAIIIGILTNFIGFTDGMWQLASIAILALVLLSLLRTKAMKKFMKPEDKEINDNFLNEEGIGIIKDGKVYFKATYWEIDSDNDDFEEGEKVNVLSAKKGKASIEHR